MTEANTVDVITLHPGDVAIGLRGQQLQTLLGSCVAVVLTDPRRTVGTMCHIVHSTPATQPGQPCGSHADMALKMMVDLLLDRGIVASKCHAYVYGGGNMFPQLVQGDGIGAQNVRWVLQALDAMGVQVVSVDAGGAVYRKLSWDVGPDSPQAVAVPL